MLAGQSAATREQQSHASAVPFQKQEVVPVPSAEQGPEHCARSRPKHRVGAKVGSHEHVCKRGGCGS